MNEYDKFVHNLNMGKEFDYSLILDMINLIDVEERMRGKNVDISELEKLIKEIKNDITDINESIDMRSKIHTGIFDANLITEEGWYDYIILNTPEGSESNEQYFLYTSSDGGQVCFSKRNSGKVYHRLGVNKPWVTVMHDDYGLQHSSSVAINNYEKIPTEVKYSEWESNPGTSPINVDNIYKLSEINAGDNCENKVIDIYKYVYLCPNDIIKVRAFYRKGTAMQGVEEYPYDSDAYIYVSDLRSSGYNISTLKSDVIKILSLGSLGYTFTEEQKNIQNLAFVRNNLFKSDDEGYGWHYVKVNVPVKGYYYLHITGTFSENKSWMVFDTSYVYNDTNKLYGPYESVQEACSAIDISFRKEGLVVGIKDYNNKIKEYWWNSSENLADEGLVPKSMTYSYDNGTLILG